MSTLATPFLQLLRQVLMISHQQQRIAQIQLHINQTSSTVSQNPDISQNTSHLTSLPSPPLPPESLNMPLLATGTGKPRVILGLMTFGPDLDAGARINSLPEYNKFLDHLTGAGYFEVDTARSYGGQYPISSPVGFHVVPYAEPRIRCIQACISRSDIHRDYPGTSAPETHSLVTLKICKY